MPTDDALYRKIRWRLLPYLLLLYVIAWFDRVNVGFAALQMNEDLGFSPAVFGFGAGIFFIGYALFEVPSNLILARVGARRWIGRIMVTWGIVSVAMMFVHECDELLRAALPAGRRRGRLPAGHPLLPRRVVSARASAPARCRGSWSGSRCRRCSAGRSPVLLLGLDGIARARAAGSGCSCIEGLPAILLGITTWLLLPDSPAQARFLDRRASDSASSGSSPPRTSRRAPGMRRVSARRCCIRRCGCSASCCSPASAAATG